MSMVINKEKRPSSTGSRSGDLASQVPVGGPRGGWAWVRRRRLAALVLVLSDVLLAVLTWQAASVLQDVWGRGPLSEVAAFSVVPNVVVWVGLRMLLGLYPGYGLSAAEELRRQTYAVGAALGTTTVFAIALHVGDLLSRLLTFAGFAGLALLAPLLRHFVKHGVRKLGIWGVPVAILGGDETGSRVIRALQKEWTLGFVPAVVFDDRKILDTFEGIPHGGTLAEAEIVIRKYGLDTAVVAMPGAHGQRLAEITDWAGTRFRRVIVIPDLGGVTNSAVVARDLAGIFGVEIKQNLLNPWARRTKRALDLLGAIIGGLLISPLLLAIAALVKVDAPGPAIYGQQRLGGGDRPFRCLKFRTMCLDAERTLDEHLQSDPDLRAEWERDRKLRRDPRVTRVGRFLRATSLDELPQLWNVLRGEMSLVGPRPIVEAEVPRYGEAYELYRRVTPGISGFWQINGRSDTSYEERVALDTYYVRNWSVWLDLVILARTVESILLQRGAH
jgi:Undecaprenyl-phosphate galactose phosphotransferase WbaP